MTESPGFDRRGWTWRGYAAPHQYGAMGRESKSLSIRKLVQLKALTGSDLAPVDPSPADAGAAERRARIGSFLEPSSLRISTIG